VNLPKDKFCKEFSYNQKEEKAEVLKQLLGSMGTIGAGSVVTKDIPANCVAVGNPCRVIRKINGEC
jgi:serine acetyltransferase